MKCSYCGKEYKEGTIICPKCHNKIEDAFGIIPLNTNNKIFDYEMVDEPFIEEASEEDYLDKTGVYLFDLNVPFTKEKDIKEKDTKENEEEDYLDKTGVYLFDLNVPFNKEEKTTEEDLENTGYLFDLIVPFDKKENKKEKIEEQNNKVNQSEIVNQNNKVNLEKQLTPVTNNNLNASLTIVDDLSNNEVKVTKRVVKYKIRKSVVVFLIALVLCGFITWKVSKTRSSNPNYSNEVASLAKEDNTIEFLGFTLKVPEGFIYNLYNGTDYIQNDEIVIMFKDESPLSYQFVNDNKDTIIESLNSQGLNVTSFESQELLGNNYVLVIGEKGENDEKREYGYMFGDLGGEKPICATIRALDNRAFNNDWFTIAAEFFKINK